MEYPSERLRIAVEQLARLPGVGSKTALRFALHLLNRPETEVDLLAQSLTDLKLYTRNCRCCHTLTEDELCSICANPRRDKHIICVVEGLKDVLAIEKTGLYQGTYHVLGGLINPLEGIGPQQLEIESLLERVQAEPDAEVVLALNARVEGETTAFYIARRLQDLPVRLSTLSRGLAVGAELEYTDELTLSRSLQQRVPYALNLQVS